MKKVKIYNISKWIICVIFILTFSLFFTIQYSYLGPSFYMHPYFNGFDLAFGLKIEGGRSGFFLFFIPVILSIIGIICALLNINSKSKTNTKVLFSICAIISFICFIIYILTYFYEINRYQEAKHYVNFSLSFFLTLSLYGFVVILSLLIFFNTKTKKTLLT